MKKNKDKLVYLLFNTLVIIAIIQQINKGDFTKVFFCIPILLIYTIPIIIEKKLKIRLSLILKIFFYSFIFVSIILGEIYNLYEKIPILDTILHISSGFLMGIIGYIIIIILNKNTKSVIILLITFTFSITIGTLWELVEFSADRYLKKDCQRDNIITNISSIEISKNKKNPLKLNEIIKTKIYSDKGNKVTIIKGGYLDIGIIDTMKDIIANLVGTIFICILEIIYIKKEKEYKFRNIFFSVIN